MTTNRTRKPKAKAKLPAKAPAVPEYKPNRAFPLVLNHGDTQAQHARNVAKQMLAPEAATLRVLSCAEGKSPLGERIDGAGVLEEMRAIQKAVNAGDLASVEAMLVAQAVALQSLSVNMIERATSQQWLPQFETYMRLGLKAQRQSCLTIEALGALKHGPAIMARLAQVNVAHGAQQVNNAPPAPALPAPPPALTHAGGVSFENPPNQVLQADGERMDTGTARGAAASDPAVETLGEIHRAEDE